MSIKNVLARERLPVVLIVALALLLRLLFLEIKPPHFDEGVNGWFVDQMTKDGYYRYDPGNYHGPFHFYVLFLFQTLFGRHIWVLRLPIVLVSAATVYLITRFDRFFSRRACLGAAVLMAVSPAFVFYGRYAIHEAWLVFCCVLFYWAIAGLWKYGTTPFLHASVLSIAGMILTKETYVIHLGCFGLAAGWMFFLRRFFPADSITPARQVWSRYDLLLSLFIAVFLIVFFYSGTFFDFSALADLARSFSKWFETGVTPELNDAAQHTAWYERIRAEFNPISIIEDHDKKAWFWIVLALRYEWPVIVSLLLMPLSLLPRREPLTVFLAIHACWTLVIYSLIPYKTPWCAISVYWPFFLLCGIFFDRVMSEVLPSRTQQQWLQTGAAFSLGLLSASSLFASVRLNFFRYVDENEPYVYVQTLKDVNKLMQPLHRLVSADPANYSLRGNVLLTSYHPLPWLLGDFPNVSFSPDDKMPPVLDADFLVVGSDRFEEVEKALKHTYLALPFQLRSGLAAGRLYLSEEKFGIFVAPVPPPRPASAAKVE